MVTMGVHSRARCRESYKPGRRPPVAAGNTSSAAAVGDNTSSVVVVVVVVVVAAWMFCSIHIAKTIDCEQVQVLSGLRHWLWCIDGPVAWLCRGSLPWPMTSEHETCQLWCHANRASPARRPPIQQTSQSRTLYLHPKQYQSAAEAQATSHHFVNTSQKAELEDPHGPGGNLTLTMVPKG